MSGCAIMRRGLPTFLGGSLICLWLAAAAAGGETVDLDAIASAWNRREAAVRVEWRHDTDGVYRFHRYQSDWIPKDERAAERRGTLIVDPARLRFESLRFTYGEHGYDAAQINAPVIAETFPERKRHPFFSALYAHFDDPQAAVRDPRVFVRLFDGKQTRDWWPGRAGEYPRGTIYEAGGTLPGARLRLVAKRGGAIHDPQSTIHDSPALPLSPGATSDLLQDLTLLGGILAFHPLHPAAGVRLEHCEIAAEPVLVDGDPCLVLTETFDRVAGVEAQLRPQRDGNEAGEVQSSTSRDARLGAPVGRPQRPEEGRSQPPDRRTFWVDPKRNMVIRRAIFGNDDAGRQIDIRYTPDERLGWVPVDWIAMFFGNDATTGPRLNATRAIVTKVEPHAKLTDDEAQIDFPAGTWVIDEAASQQYILTHDGGRREIRTSEFNWLPTYDELLATEPGQVGALVDAKVARKRYWKWARYPAGLGAAALAGALALSIWRRRRRLASRAP